MMIAAMLLLLVSAQDELEEIDCAKAGTNLELLRCAGKSFDAAEARMTAQWNKVSTYMKQQDAEFQKGGDKQYDNRPGYFDALLASQRAWITYRENTCTVNSYLMRGGSAEPLAYAGCMTEMADARTRELSELLDYYEQR